MWQHITFETDAIIGQVFSILFAPSYMRKYNRTVVS
jgi:hypothetical protein